MKKWYLTTFLAIFAAILQTAHCQLLDDEDDAAENDDPAPSYVYLLDSREVTISPNGDRRVLIHRRIRVDKPAAVEEVGEVTFQYNAYLEDAKFVAGKTTLTDGRTIEVTESAIRDAVPARIADYALYSDTRELSVSMPAVYPGAVIDYQIELTSKRQVIPGQQWDSFVFDREVPVTEARYTVTCPASMQLTISPRNLDVQPAVTTEGDVTRREWVLRDLERIRWEPGMPAWNDVVRGIAWTTLTSWDQVQTWYQGLLTGKASPNPALTARVKEATAAAGDDTLARIRAIYLFLQKDIRYVGLELGEGAYEPHAAPECFDHRYGDCKDQAVLLQTMLAEAGITSHLALVRPRWHGAVDRALPCPIEFNHAILYVPDATRPLWLDPTAKYNNPQGHPAYLDGAEALVIGLPGTQFITIPSVPPEETVDRLDLQVDLAYDGNAKVTEISEYVGRAGAHQRQSYENLDPKIRKKNVRDIIKGKGTWDHLLDYGNSDPYDLSIPFRHWFQYEGTSFFTTTPTGLSTHLSAENIARAIQLPEPTTGRGKARRARKYPWQRTSTSSEEIACHIHLPPGMKLVDAGEPYEAQLTQGFVRVAVWQEGDTIHAVATVRQTPATIQPAELAKARQETQQALAKASCNIIIQCEVRQAIADKKPNHALALADQLAKDHPDLPEVAILVGDTYRDCGRYLRAREAYRRAIELDPGQARYYSSLAMTYAGVNGYFGEGFDRPKVEEILRQGVAKSRNRDGARWNLVDSLCRNDKGVIHEGMDSLDDAIAVYKEILADDPDEVYAMVSIGDCFSSLKNYTEAETWYAKALDRQPDNSSALASRWQCLAYTGHTQEVIAQIQTEYSNRGRQERQLRQIGADFLQHRRYPDAIAFLEAAEQLAGRPDSRQAKLLGIIRQLADIPAGQTSPPVDRSTPEKTIRSLLSALLQGRREDVQALYSPRSQLRPKDLDLIITLLGGATRDTSPEMIQVSLDILQTTWKYERNDAPAGMVDLRASMPDDLAGVIPGTAGISNIRCLLEPDGEQWRVAAMGMRELPLESIARVADSYLQEGQEETAAKFADMIQEIVQRIARPGPMESTHSKLCKLTYPDTATRIHAMIGVGLLAQGSDDDDVQHLKTVAQAMPDEPLIHLALGEQYLSGERYVEAAAELAIARDKLPDDFRPLLFDFQTATRLDRFAQAGQDLDKLTTLLPSSSFVQLRRLELLTRQGKIDEAKALLDTIRPYLRPGQAWSNDAVIASVARDADRLRELKEKKPADTQDFILLQGFIKAGDWTDALDICQCQVIDGENPLTLSGLAELLVFTGDIAEAGDIVARVAVTEDLSDAQRHILASLAVATGQYELARQLIDKALAHATRRDQVYLHLFRAASLFAEGKLDEGKAECRLAGEANHPDEWPSQLIHCLVDGAAIDTCQPAIDAAEAPSVRDRYLCESAFYRGMLAIAGGQTAPGGDLLTQAVDTKAFENHELLMASGMLFRTATE